MNPILEAAREYRALGWSVIPLQPGGKNPARAWKQYQAKLAPESTLELWWTQNPEFNVGITLGGITGLVGIDIDDLEGWELLMEMSGGDLPDTLDFRSPKTDSVRLLYALPKGQESRPISYKGEDGSECLRILGTGSQTVMPPSVHPTGKIYSWTVGQSHHNMQARPAPQWLLDLFSKEKDDQLVVPMNPLQVYDPGSPNSVEGRAAAYLQKCDPAVSGQGGHDQAYKIAVKLVKGFCLGDEDALSLLLQHWNPRCQPPWSEGELRHKIKTAHKAEQEYGFLLQPKDEPMTPKKPLKPKEEPKKPRAIIHRVSDVTQKDVEWLWPGIIALGKITMLDGDPDLGKSTLTLDLAARVTSNGYMPDGFFGGQGNVLLMSAEDAVDDTIKPRFLAAQGAEECLYVLSEVFDGKETRPPEIPLDLDAIEETLKDINARLWVIDPLMAYLSGVDASKDQDVRRALYRISKVAERVNCAVICQRHLNKGSGKKAIYRGSSSIAIIGHARIGLLVAKDPDDDERRLLAVSKCNIHEKRDTMSYRLDVVGKCCRIEWGGSSHYQADDLVAEPLSSEQKEEKEENKNKEQMAAEILQDILQAGPVAAKEAKSALKEMGFAERTIERAAKKLEVVRQHVKHGKTHFYRWALKDNGEMASSTEDETE